MTETAATTGTSADATGREPADPPPHEQGTTAPEASTSEAAGADGSGTEAGGAAEPADADPPEAGGIDDGGADDGGAGAAEPAGNGSEPEPAAAGGAASTRRDSPNGSESSRPTFTRPAGMVPPPDQLDEGEPAPDDPTMAGPAAVGVPATHPWPAPGGYGEDLSAPVSAPPRVTGRQPAAGLGNPGAEAAAATAATLAGSTPVGEPIRPRPAATPRGPRRARLNLRRVDPWSVMKFSFAVSLVLFIVVIVAASVLYLALDAMGVFASINSTVAELIQSSAGDSGNTFRITAQGVIGTAAVLGALNVLLFTSLATLGAFIYNVCADLVGGVEVTLAERD